MYWLSHYTVIISTYTQHYSFWVILIVFHAHLMKRCKHSSKICFSRIFYVSLNGLNGTAAICMQKGVFLTCCCALLKIIPGFVNSSTTCMIAYIMKEFRLHWSVLNCLIEQPMAMFCYCFTKISALFLLLICFRSDSLWLLCWSASCSATILTFPLICFQFSTPFTFLVFFLV